MTTKSNWDRAREGQGPEPVVKRGVTLRDVEEARAAERRREFDKAEDYKAAKLAEHKAAIDADPHIVAVRERIAKQAEERAAAEAAKAEAQRAHAKAELDAEVERLRLEWVRVNGSAVDFDEKATRRDVAQARAAALASARDRAFRPRL